MRVSPRPVPPLVTAMGLGLGLAGCGPGGSAMACAGDVCTFQSDGPASGDLDRLDTKVGVSDLTADSVEVRIGSASAIVRRNEDPVRLGGFRVSAPETGTDDVKVRVER